MEGKGGKAGEKRYTTYKKAVTLQQHKKAGILISSRLGTVEAI